MSLLHSQDDREYYEKLKSSPIFFIKECWGLEVQPVKKQYEKQLHKIVNGTKTHQDWEREKEMISANWFGDYDYEANEWNWVEFKKGKHISWQQYLLLVGFEKAINGKAKKTISIASGRGTGKSTSLSWIILYFLFVHPDSNVPCTAPTSDQMFDVLWKELALWIHRMPEGIKQFFDWESSHIRIKESPYTWFARAKTATKENPEALSGMHADDILAVVDEGSAVDESIYIAAQGIFSSKNAYMIIISNPTRLNGYFKDTHYKNKHDWQTFQFSSKDSPLVHKDLIEKYVDQGLDSDKYRVNILGKFPKEDAVDDKSYMQLIQEKNITEIPLEQLQFNGSVALGIDPSGEGDNWTAYALRDQLVGYLPKRTQVGNAKEIAMDILTLATKFKVKPRNIICDGLGPGGKVTKEVALAGRMDIKGVNVGEPCERPDDKELYANKKAMMYWKMKLWFENGGMIVQNKQLKDELLSIRFRRNERGRIEIMKKKDMRTLGLLSPDCADALAITFLIDLNANQKYEALEAIDKSEDFDPFSVY